MDDKDKERLSHEVETLRQRNIQLEEELHKHNQLKNEMLRVNKDWELTFEAVPDLLAIIDTNYRIVRVNKAMAGKLGVTKQEAVGLTCYKHIHKTEKPLPSCPHALLLADGQEHFSEMYIEQLGGAYIISVSPLRDNEGQVIGCVHVARDCTERRLMEESLRQTEARYNLITDNMSDTIWLMDMNLNTTWISHSVERTRGFSLEEIKSLPIETQLTPESLKNVLNVVSEELTPEKLQQKGLDISKIMDLEFYRKDGSTCWSEVRFTLLRDQQGIPFGILGVGRNITDRKQAEGALKDIETRYKLITENMTDTIWIMDMNLKTTWMSPSVERNRGYSLEEINSLPLEKHFTPESLEIIMKAILAELTPEKLQQNCPISSKKMDVEYYRKDGSTYWSGVRFTLLKDQQGNPIGLLGVGRDISQRKQAEEALKDSEQRLQEIIQGSPIPTFVIGKDHRVIYWNRALEELSGIKAEEVIGTTRQWRAFYRVERPCMADLLVDQVLEVIPQWYFEKYVKSKLIEDAYEAIDFFPALGDTGKWLRFTGALIRDSQGGPIGAIETLQDVTERKQSRDTLEKLVQERTADLTMKNEQLISEIKERKQAEAELKKRKRDVETKSKKLEELNTTLKTLLKHREDDKKETEERVMSNVKALLMPAIEKLKTRRLDAKSMFHLSMLESNLLDIISPFSHKLSSKYLYLTPKEIQVANLVKEGKSTKEIAEMMDVSSYAIELHRFHIRKKLGLKTRKINLKSYLLSIS